MQSINEMKKPELRAACKENGIKNYGKMDNAAMKAALANTSSLLTRGANEGVEELRKASSVALKSGSRVAVARKPKEKVPSKVVLEVGEVFQGDGLAISNNVKIVERKTVLQVQGGPVMEVVQHAMASRAGVDVPFTNQQAEVTPVKERAGGPKRPGVGTICDRIWKLIDSFIAEGKVVRLRDIVAAAQDKGINKATARTQFARYHEYKNYHEGK